MFVSEEGRRGVMFMCAHVYNLLFAVKQ